MKTTIKLHKPNKQINIYFSSLGWLSIFTLCILLATALWGMFLPYEQYAIPSGNSLEPPSKLHILGTDDLGIDLFAQFCRGAGTSFLVGFFVALLSGVGGCILGTLAAYHGRWIDKIICSFCDITIIVPHLPLLIIISTFFEPSLILIIFSLTILSWVQPIRTSRAKILSLKQEKFIIASKCYGASFFYILLRHFLPLLTPIIIVNIIQIMSKAIVLEASLTFLGLGSTSSKSWGVILNHAISFPGIYYTNFWIWWLLPPVIALGLLILSISWIGRELEDFIQK